MIKLIFVFVISYISLSDACSCYRPDPASWPRDTYCKSTFAGTIRVLAPSFTCGSMQRCYPITVVNQIRGTPISPIIVRTPEQSATCGVFLTPGNTYFVAINTDPNNPYIIGLYLCDLFENWSAFTPIEVNTKLQAYRQMLCRRVTPIGPIGPIETIQPIEPVEDSTIRIDD